MSSINKVSLKGFRREGERGCGFNSPANKN